MGTVMPSAIVESAFKAYRGDVTAVGHWESGRWRLEVRRRKSTGSVYDVDLGPGT